MSVDMYKRVTQSIGYINMIKGLDEFFPNNYEILEVVPSDDDTSYDFRTNINIGNVQGIDISVGFSGNSHQFQLGEGIIGIAVPVTSGFFILPSGKKGEALEDVLNDNELKTEASANQLDQVKKIFMTLKMYLEGNIK